jgi:hypothetical protein
MAIRWIAAFVLGYLLGGIILVILYLFISLHQAVYVLWGKQKAPPLQLLCIISANLFPRFLGGVVAVNATIWHGLSFILICILSILTYLISFGTLALFWRIEKEDLIEKDRLETPNDNMPRPQSGFFLRNGERWQHRGFLAAVILSGLTLSIYIVLQNCNIGLLHLQSITGLCSVVNNFVHKNEYSKPTLLLVSVFLLALSLICSRFVVWSFSRFRFQIKDVVVATKKIATPVLISAYHVVLILAMVWKSSLLLLIGFSLMSITFLVWFEDMTYDEFSGDALRRKLPIILGEMYAFLFTAPRK